MADPRRPARVEDRVGVKPCTREAAAATSGSGIDPRIFDAVAFVSSGEQY